VIKGQRDNGWTDRWILGQTDRKSPKGDTRAEGERWKSRNEIEEKKMVELF
jgi:hypothetical protein